MVFLYLYNGLKEKYDVDENRAPEWILLHNLCLKFYKNKVNKFLENFR